MNTLLITSEQCGGEKKQSDEKQRELMSYRAIEGEEGEGEREKEVGCT